MKKIIFTIVLNFLVAISFSQEKINTENGAKSDFIYKDGKIGIGTSTPNAKLEIKSNLPSPASYNSQYWSTSNSDYNLKLETVWDNNGINYNFIQKFAGINYKSLSFFYGKVGVGTATPLTDFHIKGINPILYVESAQTGQSGIEFGSLSNKGKGGIYYSDNADDMWFKTNSISRFYISSKGNIGIGTSTPSFRLHVHDNTNFGSVNTNMTRPFALTHKDGGGFLIQPSIHYGYSSSNPLWLINSYGSEPIAIQGGASAEIDKTKLTIFNPDGSVGIGTITTFGYKLAVNGVIGAKEIQVETTSSWPDYVFSSDYNLKPLEEVESFIEQNNHLPDIPSEKEVKEKGINLGDMDAKLLQKIEELTLYIIQQNKKIEDMQRQINELKK